MEIKELHKIFIASAGVSTDTRKIEPNTLFFALKGDNFNGNKFALNALEAGCSFAIVDEKQASEDERIILVESVLKTLQELANFHRKQFDIPVLGITGSNGKTTTKELIGAVLSKKYNLLITEGNLNNHLGVPFTLLKLNKDHTFAVIEMGANKPGDIKELAEIAEPNIGMITNVGAAHIEGFGSLQGVINTKRELFTFLEGVNGGVFFNSDDELICSVLPKVDRQMCYGEQTGEISGEVVSLDPFVQFKWKTATYESNNISTHLVGKYNLVNFLAAIAVGVEFEIDADDICSAIEEYIPSNNRSQVQKTDRNTIIVDCYNANATSMMAALESFVAMSSTNKLLILGDMLELGDISINEHQKINDFIEANGLNAYFVGEEFQKIETSFERFRNVEELIESKKIAEIDAAMVLLKGSRGIQLENLIAYL